MDKNYAVVETSKLAAVRGGGHIYSLIHDDDVENGCVGYVGALAEDVEGQETYEFGVFDEDTLGKHKVILVATPEWSYEDCHRDRQALYNFINEAGVVFRGFDLIVNDVYAVSAPAINAGEIEEIKANQYLITEAGSMKLKLVATEAETADSAFVAKIEGKAVRNYGWEAKNGNYYGRKSVVYFVRVLKND